MEKKVNTLSISIAIELGLLKFEKEMKEKFEEWPEDPNGVRVTFEDFNMAYVKFRDYGMKLVEELLGKLPEPIQPEPDPEVEEIEQEDLPYETKFHHTMTDTKFTGDGGTSLVSCPGQHWGFVSVYCNGVRIPRHRSDSHRDEDDREGYWNMFEAPVGDIIATDKNGKKYRFKTKKDGMIKGSCK